jgi:hypothetical protein
LKKDIVVPCASLCLADPHRFKPNNRKKVHLFFLVIFCLGEGHCDILSEKRQKSKKRKGKGGGRANCLLKNSKTCAKSSAKIFIAQNSSKEEKKKQIPGKNTR